MQTMFKDFMETQQGKNGTNGNNGNNGNNNLNNNQNHNNNRDFKTAEPLVCQGHDGDVKPIIYCWSQRTTRHICHTSST